MPDYSRNIHERFLRHVWSRRYLDESRLRTRDGRSVSVVDPGTLNLDGGPDFRNARIRIGPTTFAGDVEIHRTTQDWFAHRHHNDARYNRVILHVVLEGTAHAALTTSQSGRNIPVLILSDFLSESIQSIWRRAILDERARRAETIRCTDKNKAVSDLVLTELLRKLAVERLEVKLRRFEERLRQLAYEQKMAIREAPATYGEPPIEGFPDEIPVPSGELTQRDFSNKNIWEQVLYEGLMEGLGYAKNRDPFIRLSRSISLRLIRELHLTDDDHRRIAVLFAVAGLLPKVKSMKERNSKEYVRMLSRSWHGLRSMVRVDKLRSADWQFFPTRPNNFPTLRIGAANVLLRRILNEELFRSFIQGLKQAEHAPEGRRALTNLLTVREEGYWSVHYDFDQPTSRRILALGGTRVDELIVNVVIPLGLLYARIFKDTNIRSNALDLYETFPAGQDNTITRLMSAQLLHEKITIATAAQQQGLIQLYNYYCRDLRCTDCEVGRLVFHDD